MNLIRLMFKQFRLTLLLVFVLSITSAGLAVGVIAFANETMLHPEGKLGLTLLKFAGLLVAVFLIGTAAQISMTALGHRLVYQLRRTMVKRVLDTELERLEALGPARILASLSSDTSHLTSAFISLPSAIYGLVLNLGGFAYLAWLSRPLFIATAAWLLLTIAIAWLLMRKTHARIDSARGIEDLLYEDYQAVLMGRKELALNRERARRFYEQEFDRHAAEGRDHEIAADIYNGINENWVNIMILGSVGMIFFLAHGSGWAVGEVATTYSVTILFLRTSLAALVSAVPGLMAGSVALNKLNALELPDYKPDFASFPERVPVNWNTLHFDEVTYRYANAAFGNHFAVGPLQWVLRQGETVFLIGGNGSGKSTLTRLLTGLYQAHAGQLLVDGIPVNETNLATFRHLFSTVFSDFHLFHQLLGAGGNPADPEKTAYWLQLLDLTHKVSVKNGRLQDTRLSQGQRKRLALLVAILEDRPIIVLDEWAADQDPGYRRTFYFEVLPLLKSLGKTIVAVTHDEHYFHVADRILKMDEGHLLEVQPTCNHHALID